MEECDPIGLAFLWGRQLYRGATEHKHFFIGQFLADVEAFWVQQYSAICLDVRRKESVNVIRFLLGGAVKQDV